MGIVILQKRKLRGQNRIEADCVHVTIAHSIKEKRRDGSPVIYLRVVFGINVPYSEFYTIGAEGNKIVLVPVTEDVGFKVGKTTHSGYGVARINLTNETIGLLPAEWQKAIRSEEVVEFESVFDYEGKKVLINGIQKR